MGGKGYGLGGGKGVWARWGEGVWATRRGGGITRRFPRKTLLPNSGDFVFTTICRQKEHYSSILPRQNVKDFVFYIPSDILTKPEFLIQSCGQTFAI